MNEVDANSVIRELGQQISQQAVQIAVLRVRVAELETASAKAVDGDGVTADR